MLRKRVSSSHKFIYTNTDKSPAPKEIAEGVIISLPRAREERLLPLMKNIERVSQLSFTVLDGVDGDAVPNNSKMCNGAYGCLLSHVEAIKMARERKLPAVFILEDDAELVDGFDERLKAVMQKAGDRWDAIWLGGINGEKPTKHNELLNETRGCWSTYGYVLRSTIYNYCISGLSSLRTTTDDWYRLYMHPKYLCLKVKDDLVFHRSELPSMVNPGKDWTKHPIHV